MEYALLSPQLVRAGQGVICCQGLPWCHPLWQLPPSQRQHCLRCHFSTIIKVGLEGLDPLEGRGRWYGEEWCGNHELCLPNISSPPLHRVVGLAPVPLWLGVVM